MKRIFIVSCLLTFAFLVSAQGGQGQGGQRQGGQGGGFRQLTPEEIAEQQAQWKKDLNLNDKQFAEFKKIDEDFRKKQTAVRQNAAGDREKMREENTKLTTERNTKLKAALTADQFKKYEEIIAQRRQGGGQGNRQGGGNRQN